MLLVDDNEPERRHRREHGRARADHDRRAAGARRAPGLEPRAVRERGVQGDDRGGEALAEARHELRRQRDLRDQHQRAAARREHALDQVQVHLRLAAAGDAVQQESGEAPERAADRRHRPGLVGRQHGPRPSGARGRRRCAAREGFDPAARGERARRGGVARGRNGSLRRAVLAEQPDQRLLAAAETRAPGDRRPAGIRGSPDDFLARCCGAFAQHLRHGAEENVAERVVVIVGGPAQHAESRLVPERRGVDRLGHRFQARARPFARPGERGDDTDGPLPAERHAHALARLRDRRAGRREIVEALAHRRVEHDLQDGRRGGQKVLFNQ